MRHLLYRLLQGQIIIPSVILFVKKKINLKLNTKSNSKSDEKSNSILTVRSKLDGSREIQLNKRNHSDNHERCRWNFVYLEHNQFKNTHKLEFYRSLLFRYGWSPILLSHAIWWFFCLLVFWNYRWKLSLMTINTTATGWVIAIYKIIQIVRALWLTIKPFYMSVCKHGFRSSFVSYFIKEM